MVGAYNGILPCFFFGIVSTLVSSIRKDRISRRAGLVRLDHVVDESVLRGDERAGEAIVEFGDFLLAQIAVAAASSRR